MKPGASELPARRARRRRNCCTARRRRRRHAPPRGAPQSPLPPGPRPTQPLPDPSDWTFELIEQYHDVIRATAQRFGLDTYPNQLEIITAEQMMDAYASVGMPVNYRHWCYGKEFIATEKSYRRGQMGLAYEIVINSNPCISYLMEENTTDDAGAGDRARGLRPQQLLQGQLPVPHVDRCVVDHRLPGLREELHRRVRGAPRHRRGRGTARLLPRAAELRRRPLPAAEPDVAGARNRRARAEREAYAQMQVNDIWRTLPKRAENAPSRAPTAKRFPAEPQENLLYFIEKNAPLLEPWQREVVRIVRKIAQYFYPQRQTQVMNEGWATFWHHHLLNTLYDEGYLTDGVMIEWLKSHTNVVYQPPVGHRALQRHQPVRARLRDVDRHQAHLREPDRRRPRLVPGHRRHAWLPALRPRDAQLQGRELHRPVPVAEADPRLAPVRDPRRRDAATSSRSRRSTTTPATATCARRCRASTT